MVTITFEQLKTEVLRLAAEHPNAVYKKLTIDHTRRTCFYTVGECGSGVGCIFGQALVNLDNSLAEKLAAIDNDLIGNSSIVFIATELGIVATIEELAKCGCVQAKQDLGTPWSEAVKAFGVN